MHHLHFHLQVGALLPHKLTRPVKELFGSVAILGLAIAAANLFEPIYLFTIGRSVREIVQFYLVVYALYFVLIPLGAKFAARFGFERTILVGSLLYVPYFLLLYEIGNEPTLFYVAAAAFAVQKMFYWVGYHAYFAKASTGGEEGREIGGITLIITLVTILGPVAGGAIAAFFGFRTLFICVVVFVLLSNIPFFLSKKTYERTNFSYWRSFPQLVRKNEWRYTLASLGYGEAFFLVTLWPIFLYVVLEGTFRVGLIVTAASIVTSLPLLYIGKLIDAKTRQKIHGAGVLITSFSWFARIALSSALHLFFIESLHRIGRGAAEFPFLADTYERAKRGNPLQTVVGFEMGLIVGKLIAIGLFLWLLSLGAPVWPTVFVLAAMFTLCFKFLPLAAPKQ